MTDLAHVKGLRELQNLLNTLPAKMEANVLRGALREGAGLVLAEAKRNVPVDSGLLRDGLKITTNRKNGRVMARVRAAGKHGYLANWLEFGTAAHSIKPRRKKVLRIGGAFFGEAMHPGTKPRPFMRPALDARAGQAVVAAGNYIKKRLATKHGLDTADITIEEIDDES